MYCISYGNFKSGPPARTPRFLNVCDCCSIARLTGPCRSCGASLRSRNASKRAILSTRSAHRRVSKTFFASDGRPVVESGC